MAVEVSPKVEAQASKWVMLFLFRVPYCRYRCMVYISVMLLLMGVVFLFLVIFREQLLAALVGGGRNSGFIVAPLDDGDFTMRAWQEYVLLSPGFGAKK